MPPSRDGNCKVSMTAISAYSGMGWFLANELDIQFDFVPGSENTGADLLSRRASGIVVKDAFRPIPEVNQISVWDEIWDEHMNVHWGNQQVFLGTLEKRI